MGVSSQLHASAALPQSLPVPTEQESYTHTKKQTRSQKNILWYRILVGRPEGRRPIGRPWRRWEDNIKMGLQEVGWGSMDWIDMAQDRDACECGNEPSGSIKCGEFLD
jgi:hypothetical protein